MNYVPQLFESSWAQALGWTLLHSLWQSFIVLGIVVILFRFIPGRHSSVRYGIAAAGLLIMFLTSAATFIYSIGTISPFAYQHSSDLSSHTVQQAAGSDVATSLWDQVHYMLQSNIPLITGCWLAGALFFCLRLAGSWWYVSSLKRQAKVLDNEWSIRITALARQFNIDRIVTLAETVHLSAPAVVGYLKPVILIPVGMLSGLSTEQVESILIHELTHIRRHDYLVNIIQSLVEALFFFNPFVWIVSNIIRREREHCCDDAVVAHSNASAYAYALVQLEESRLTRTGLALSLAENKNQLLNRITRIMEKSVRNYSGREKIIPVLLLVAGLLCASWITIQTQPGKGKGQQQDKISVADTTIKKHHKRIPPSPKKITTVEADARPHVEITEEFEVMEAPEPVVAIPPLEEDPSIHLDMDEFMIPPIPPIDMDMNFQMDTIPPVKWSQNRDWEKFSKEFELKFKEQFGDFYQQHQEDFQKMMQEFRNDFQFKYDDKWSKDMNAKMKARTDQLKVHTDQLKVQAKAMKVQAKAMDYQKAMKMDMEKQFQYKEKQLEEVEKKLKSMEENLARFEKALQEQLIKDGYLKNDEKISTMHWNDEGLEINGIKIKESDLPRYQELNDRYFKVE